MKKLRNKLKQKKYETTKLRKCNEKTKKPKNMKKKTDKNHTDITVTTKFRSPN